MLKTVINIKPAKRNINFESFFINKICVAKVTK